MKLRSKLLLIALVPVLAAMALTALLLRQQQYDLAQRQQALVKRWATEGTQNELRHYVALALSTISPYYNTGRNDADIRQQAMRQLAGLDYGPDGYFFLYDYDGTVLMHPRQTELRGQNLIAQQDSTGLPAIRLMIDKARAGGGFVAYTWNKPSSHEQAPKLAYVTGLDRWHWMIGTGVYTDDLNAVLSNFDRQLEASIDTSMRWIALAATVSAAIIVASFMLVTISERRVADAKLTLLARQVVGSQEEERAYLSRELHDGTSQTLVSIKLLTEAALDQLPPESGAARAALTRAVSRLQDALAEVRGMSHRLRPVMLDTLGLSAALGQLADEMWTRSPTRFTMRVEGLVFDLPEEIKTVLFRVTQEALTNIQKHAQATQVGLRLVFSERSLQLRLQDNGTGFDTDAVLQDPKRGIGLRNMRERLASIDGRLTLQSRPGQTLIVADVPREAILRFAAASDTAAAAAT